MNEFELISKYLKPLASSNSGSLKLSDDIYFDTKKGIGISVDTYVQGVHFIDASNPNKFLKKILRASLSDLYCKGIKPKSYFLSLAINNKIATNSWLNQFKKILSYEQKKFKISLAGGDTTYSSKVIISIIVLGHSKSKPIYRKKSSFNDDIYITGNIGDAYLGLTIIKKKNNFGKYNEYFKKKYYEPDLQSKISLHLKKIASSSIDISDGLGQDLQHICLNSKCGAFVDLNLLPLSPFCKNLLMKKRIKLTEIFSKGDDYQILFTSKPKNRSKIFSLSKKLNKKISRIGYIKKGKNIMFKHNMKNFSIKGKKMGYIHNF